MNREDIRQIILKSFNENKNSHAFLFVTNNIDKCLSYTQEIIKKVSCVKNQDDNCNCNSCRMLTNNSNPDSIIISPEGREILVEQVKDLLQKFVSKPVFSKKLTYIINKADTLNVSAANKLLKFLEEPESDIVGFYITDNLQGILPTIQSRCEIFNINFELTNILDLLNISELEFDKYYNTSLKLLFLLNDSPKYVLMNESKNYSKYERDEILKLIYMIKNMYIIKYQFLMKEIEYNSYLDQIIENITTEDIKIIVKRIKILDNILNESKYNVNKELIFNKLFVIWE